LQNRDEAGVYFEGINLPDICRQRLSESPISGPDFDYNIIRMQFRGFDDPSEHMGIDDKMLP
jgi:hypothetical protein